MKVNVQLAAETLFHIGPIPVTNSMLLMFIVMAALLLGLSLVARRLQEIPGRGQGFVELVVEFLLDLVDGTAGRTAGRKLFPFIGGLFIFIIVANYSGLLPGVGTIGFYQEEAEAPAAASRPATADVAALPPAVTANQAVTADQAAPEQANRVLVPFVRGPNSDLNMTLAMALLAFGSVQVLGVRRHGIGGRIKHMADPPLLFPIELVSELSRIISLSFRLFGNIFAGEVLLAVMYAMANAIKIAVIPLLFPVIFLFLEVLFGFIQALVFALLTLSYIVLATAGGHDEAGHVDHVEEPPAERAAHGQAVVPASAGD